jgi:hypothetical protein
LFTALVWVWCGGVFIFGMRAFGGWLVLQRLRRTAQETMSQALLERCRRLQQRMGITQFVRYAHSEMVDAPAVVGWIRPVVLIPISLVAGLSTEQLEAIVAHELAHIGRYDALVNLFQIAVETLLFYHPAVWWVNRVIRAERENCCDDMAVAVCGDASEYARALAAMGSSQARPAWAMAANGGALKARIGRLLGMNKITHGLPRAGLAVLALLCASCVVLAAGVFKQDAPVTPPPPPPPAAPAAPDVSAPSVEELLLQAKALRHKTETLSELHREMRDGGDDQKTEEPAGGSYIDSLASAGLTKLTVDDLIALKIQGVTADYVRQIKAAGLDPSVRELIGMKVQGVTPEYIRDVRATGLKPSLHDLMGLKVQGVTPEFIRALQSAGLGDLQLRDVMAAKVQGITPEFIEKVRSHGFKDLTFRQLLGLKIAGVF